MKSILLELAEFRKVSCRTLDDLKNDIASIEDLMEAQRISYVEELAHICNFKEIFSFLNGKLLDNILHVGDLTKRYELKEEKSCEPLAVLHISFAIDIGGIYLYVGDDAENEEELHLYGFGDNPDINAIKDMANKMEAIINSYKAKLALKLNQEL